LKTRYHMGRPKRKNRDGTPMARIFISYSRRDMDFVRQLNDALVAHKREAWVDWKDIPLTAEWQQEILTNIEAADSFIFVISPDSASSPNCRQEIHHAVSNNKRMVPIFRRSVPDDAIPPALGRFQRIDFTADEEFDQKFAALIAALDTDLAWVQDHTRLLTRAKEWEREGKDNSFLLHGKDLREAEQWVAKGAEKEPKPTALHSQYILASRQSATRLQRIVIGAVTIAFLIAVGLAVYAFIEKNLAKEETAAAQRSARESKAREFTAYAAMSQTEDPAVSLFLGWQAAQASRPLAPGLERVLDEALFTGSLGTLRGHQEIVSSVSWNPDGKSLASVGDHGTVKLWDAGTGQELRTFSVRLLEVDHVAWSPDGKGLAIAGVMEEDTFPDLLQVWDVGTGKKLIDLSADLPSVKSMAWSPDNKFIAFANRETVQVSDASTGRELRKFIGHQGRVRSIAWSPDSKRLASASDDRTIVLWDAGTGQKLLTLRDQGNNLFSSVAWSPDGKSLASGRKGGATLWDVATGKELYTLDSDRVEISSVTWSPDGKSLAAAGSDRSVKLWHVGTVSKLRSFGGHRGDVTSVAWSADGKSLASASYDRSVKLWDAGPGQETRILRNQDHGFLSVAWGPDGRSLASTNDDHVLTQWDVGTGEEIGTFKLDPDARHVAWSTDRKFFVSIEDTDNTLKVWDSGTGHELRTLRGHQNHVESAAWSPDGKYVASASDDNTVKVWDAGTGQELRTLLTDANRVSDVEWSSDGKLLAAASNNDYGKKYVVNLWDVNTGQELRTFGGHQLGVASVSWSPDGKTLASAGSDGMVILWDVNTGEELRTLRSDPLGVERVAWSPDGRALASVDRHDTVTLWDAGTGQELCFLRGHQGNVTSVAWSPDGKSIASASEDATVRIYPVAPDLLLGLVRDRIQRVVLDKQSCERYFGSATCPTVK
jgi:WD40 repeat protein